MTVTHIFGLLMFYLQSVFSELVGIAILVCLPFNGKVKCVCISDFAWADVQSGGSHFAMISVGVELACVTSSDCVGVWAPVCKLWLCQFEWQCLQVVVTCDCIEV